MAELARDADGRPVKGKATVSDVTLPKFGAVLILR